MTPSNYCTPKIPNSTMMKDKKIVALNNSGSEDNRVATSLLILGNAFMLLKGLSTLKVLRERKFTLVATKSNILKRVENTMLTQR